MGSGSEPSNGLPFVPARSHSVAVTLITPHGRRMQLTSLLQLSESRRPVRPHGAASKDLKEESGQGEHVHYLYREALASGKLYSPLT